MITKESQTGKAKQKKSGYIRVNKQPERSPSIIQEYEEVEGFTVPHECYYGRKNRLISFAAGLWVNLTPEQHSEAHRAGKFDFKLKQLGQTEYEKTHTRQEFRGLIGRSYLDMTLKQWMKGL